MIERAGTGYGAGDTPRPVLCACLPLSGELYRCVCVWWPPPSVFTPRTPSALCVRPCAALAALGFRVALPTSPLPSSSLRSPSWPRAFLIRLRAFLRTQRIATNLAPLRVFTTLVYLLLSFFEQPAWW